MDSLRDACAYFQQDLLSFTLPGVIYWLTGEIRRTQCGILYPPVFEQT